MAFRNISNCGRWGRLGHALKRSQTRSLATLAEDVKSDAAFSIPLIDFSKFRTAASQAEKRRTADDIVRGFKEVGFIYLNKHGISDDTVQHTFKKSAEFFRLPMEAKSQLAWEDPRANRGYVQIGRERVTQSADAIAIGLDLDEMFFEDKIHEQYHNLRLLNYPPIRRQLLQQEGQARAGAHSDYGTLTLLFQDSVGGLEVQNPHTKQFQPAPPIPGTIVINAGDLLARWSNDVLRSTLHRVVAPPAKQVSATESITPARQSIAFFCNPNAGAHIACLPTCAGKEAKYAPVTTEEYIVGRLSATYS